MRIATGESALMAGSNGPKDNGPKSTPPKADPAKGGVTSEPAAPATAAAKPSWLLRLTRAVGSAVAAPFKAVGRVAASAGGAVAAAGRTVTAALGGAFRRETAAAVAAVAAAVAAVAVWFGAVDSETRRVSADLLTQFNSDEMWKARLTLERYYYLLAGDRTAPGDLARQTEDYFKTLVYQKATLPNNRNQDRNRFGSDRDRQEDFLRQVDQSRQRIKNFYEDVIVFSEHRLLTNAFRDKVLKTRFHRNAGDFLECFWLPVELGQNAALYQGRKADNERRACQVIDWYRDKYPVAGRPAASCVPYAPKPPDFCVDPKAETVVSE
jgi:hypothetical protein